MSNIQDLVAHFLHSNNYKETLKHFEREHGEPFNFDIDEPLNAILEDREVFKKLPASNANNSASGKLFENWKAPYPTETKELSALSSLNLLFISVLISEIKIQGVTYNIVLLTSTDKKLIVYDLTQEKIVLVAHDLVRSVIKNVVSLSNDGKFAISGMNGKLYIIQFSIVGGEFTVKINFEIQCHKRLIANLTYLNYSGSIGYLCTTGWDNLIIFYKLELSSDTIVKLKELKFSPNGSSVVGLNYENTVLFFVGQVDSTLINCFTIDTAGSTVQQLSKISINDAQFATHDFTPMSIKIAYVKSVPYLAVGTSQIPYLRVVIISIEEVTKQHNIAQLEQLNIDSSSSSPAPVSITPPIFRDLIIKNLNSVSPQDKYSTGTIEWRVNASGVWVVGDDGILRGIDIRSERVVAEIPVAQNKIKSIAVGIYHNTEIVVCCGVDKIVRSITEG